jgi:hypothetical protein
MALSQLQLVENIAHVYRMIDSASALSWRDVGQIVIKTTMGRALQLPIPRRSVNSIPRERNIDKPRPGTRPSRVHVRRFYGVPNFHNLSNRVLKVKPKRRSKNGSGNAHRVKKLFGATDKKKIY